jgi:hypothetical protein
MTGPARLALVLVGCAALWPACGPGTPFTPTLVGPPASTLAPNASPTASLSGIWVGNRPGDGMILSFSGCGDCTDVPLFAAADVALNVSDSSHALSGSATLTVREAPPAGCPAEPDCSHGRVGEVIPASVTGTVGAGGHVTMQWTATLGGGGQVPAPILFDLEGAVFSNRMSGTATVTGPAVPGGSATGTWSVNLQ